jgi:polyisoprenoid-binding protein YceI
LPGSLGASTNALELLRTAASSALHGDDMKLSTFGLVLALLAPAAASGATYEVDAAHSTAAFTIKHLMVSTVHGKFNKFAGTVEVDDQNHANDKLNIDIDASSIDTDNGKRDGHLKSPDFFDVAKYPKITYVSKSVKVLNAGKLEVTGDLTMHGVTRPVVLTVSDVSPEIVSAMDKQVHRGATATGTINRQDFGLKWNAPASSKAGDMVLGDDVKIQIDVEMVAKKASK